MANLSADSKLTFADDTVANVISQDFAGSEEKDLRFECTGTMDLICNRADTATAPSFVFVLGYPYFRLAGESLVDGHFALQGDVVILGSGAKIQFSDSGNTASNRCSLGSDTQKRKLKFLRGTDELLVLDADQIDFKESQVEFSGARMTVNGENARLKTTVYTGSTGPSGATNGQVILRSNESGKALLCRSNGAWKKVDLIS